MKHCRAASRLVLIASVLLGPTALRGNDPAFVATIPTAATPFGVAVNPVTNRVYVAHRGEGLVTVIDGHTNSITATLPVGSNPVAVAVNSATNKIYVADFSFGGDVWVIDGSTHAVSLAASVGAAPLAISVNPMTNRVYLAQWSSHTVAVLDGATNTVVASISVGSRPFHLAVNTTTDRVYVSNNDDDTASVIDGATNTVLATIPTGTDPRHVAVDSARNRAYVGSGFDGAVTVIDGNTLGVEAAVPVIHPEGMAVDPGTSRIYVANNPHSSITVIDGLTNTVIGAAATPGPSVVGLALNIVTKRIYVCDYDGPSVTVLADEPSASPRVTYEFSGTASVVDAGNLIGGSDTGVPFAGSFSFDPDAPILGTPNDPILGTTVATYRMSPPLGPNELAITIRGVDIEAEPGTPLDISMQDGTPFPGNPNPTDSFHLRSSYPKTEGVAVVPHAVSSIDLVFLDSSGVIFPDESVPTAFDLADFNLAQIVIQFRDPNAAGTILYQITGNLDALAPRECHDPTADLSTASNPNGAWSYGYSDTLTSGFVPYTNNSTPAGFEGLEFWYWEGTGGSDVVPAVWRNPTPNPIDPAGGPETEPGEAAFHPGPNGEYSWYRFTAPAAGDYDVYASFSLMITGGCTGTTDVRVVRSGTELAALTLNDGTEVPQSFSSVLALAVGDTLDFGVGMNGDNFNCDATHIDATICLVDSAPNDTDPPIVDVTAPAAGDVISATSVTLSADVADASETTVTSTPTGIQDTLPAGGGSVSASVSLATEGANVLVVSAVDESGNVGADSVTVIRDTTAPSVTIVSPASGAVFGVSPATLTVDVGDATATTVSFGDNDYLLPAAGGQVLGDVDLLEGVNSVTVTVVDAGGNSTQTAVDIVLDLAAPIVTIDTPLDGACFGPGEETVPVTATIDDSTATTVGSAPSGVSASLPAGGGIAVGAVALDEGLNSITVEATDAAGRVGSDVVSVTLDTTAPSVTLTSPADSDAVSGEIDIDALPIDIAPGSGIDRVELEVDGNLFATLTASPYGAVFDTRTVADGHHTLTARAFDGKGNAATASAEVLVDNTAPTVAFTSPLDGEFVMGSTALEVTANDAGSGIVSVEILADGDAPTVDPSATIAPPQAITVLSGSEDTTLRPDGELGFSALAIDDAGNETLVEIVVTVDNTAPEKTIVRPSRRRVRGTIPIEAVADDAYLDRIEILVDGNLIGSSTTSPFSTTFDTRARIDGELEITAAVHDLAGNVSTCSITVVVDNIRLRLRPHVLDIERDDDDDDEDDDDDDYAIAILRGASVGLLIPIESHDISLRVPGGSPAPAVQNWSGDDATAQSAYGTSLRIRFRRQDLENAILAGIVVGEIGARARRVPVELVVDGQVQAKTRIRICIDD